MHTIKKITVFIACMVIVPIGVIVFQRKSSVETNEKRTGPRTEVIAKGDVTAISTNPTTIASSPKAKDSDQSANLRIQNAQSDQDRLTILSSWVKTDPDGAFMWLLNNNPKIDLTQQHRAFFAALLEAHPDRLGEYLQKVDGLSASYPMANSTADERSRFTVRNIIAALINATKGHNFHTALLNARDAFQGEIGISIEYAIARDWAAKSDNPAQIISWLTESDRSLLERKSTFRMVLDHWTRRSPTEAASWAASAINKGLLPPETMDSIMFRWGQIDAASAFEWLDLTIRAEATPPWLDPAISSLVLGIAGESPAEAIRWTNEIEDTDTRKKTLAALPKWTWDSKATWDAAVLAHLKLPNDQPEISTSPTQWLKTIHSETIKKQATGYLPSQQAP